jgi:serine/threonine protein kinase
VHERLPWPGESFLCAERLLAVDLGRYRLVAELARGGMGIIHLAEARGPGGFEKLVVVKELKRELAEDPVYTAMFLDEARLAARLTHRHIVQTNEVACENGRYFMALELLEGGSLHQIRTKLGLRGLPVNLGLRALVAVLEALEHAHALTDEDGCSLGIVHRDVSPQNVFLTFDGDVKLIDFGVAKSADRRGQAVTRVGVVKGSVPYMSPDHVDGSAIDRRADVFAVGVMLRELLVGERLWGDADDFTILRRLISRDLPAFPASADVPVGLRAIATRAMAPRRADRYPTAAAMRDDLEIYLDRIDPRGSLEDLGAWLGENLKEERAAFREIVRRGRASAAITKPGTPPARAQMWLPSSDLMTRFSGVPALAVVVPPPLPVRKAAARTSLRTIGAGVMFAMALALAGVGLVHPMGASEAPLAAAPRAPRTAEDMAPSTLVTTLAVRELPNASEVATAEEAVAAEPPTAIIPVRDAVLQESR